MAAHATGVPTPDRSQMLDDLIMGTNSSSIVSKRSVEKLYYPLEPHFFRYFVKKFQRRAPLINRGYWLRLRAIDVMVREFLQKPGTSTKVVVNLGCGSDVLPWQSHVRYPGDCRNATFVDVDYPDLILKKRSIVLETPELANLLGSDFSCSNEDANGVVLRSPKYSQVACDLREPENLRQALARICDLSKCEVLFIGEVSITYMDTKSADALIEWASTLQNVTFCLLEQILPLGPDHPFAVTMLKHFNKLKTPPRSVLSYQSLNSQKNRFLSRGWSNVQIWDLWQAWSSPQFVTAEERRDLDVVEPFDEWEEFVLFARHYFVLKAESQAPPSRDETTENRPEAKPSGGVATMEVSSVLGAPPRRFGNSIIIVDTLGTPKLATIMGLGANSRSDTYDLFSFCSDIRVPEISATGPSPRVCATLTELGNYGNLLAGGRASPSCVSSECWLASATEPLQWNATYKLPVGLFRHAATNLQGSSLALVAGGKINSSDISEEYYLFDPRKGWICCKARGVAPEPVFGANIISFALEHEKTTSFSGWYFGGINKDGLFSKNCHRWTLDISEEPIITFGKVTDYGANAQLRRFGASTAKIGPITLVCGGVGEDRLIQGQSITLLNESLEVPQPVSAEIVPKDGTEPPFMIGSSVISTGDSLCITGGGATCFSMGTYWEPRSYLLSLYVDGQPVAKPQPETKRAQATRCPQFLQASRVVGMVRQSHGQQLPHGITERPNHQEIRRLNLESSDEFRTVLESGEPAVISGLDLGDCVRSWTNEYLVRCVGPEKEVIVHECEHIAGKMDFNSKNFRYVKLSFSAMMERISKGDRLYLRSLSTENPSERPAQLGEDFPQLAKDFKLADSLSLDSKNIFSSILRISGKVNMWLHYDVMANVYAQVQGSKRMILFPPSDVSHLAFAPGASSSSLDVFGEGNKEVRAYTHPYETVLEPGDVLFLPSMWLHSATPLTESSVAVNIFFRDMAKGYSGGRDVYGNKDLPAYEKGRQDISRIKKALQGLPRETQRFYSLRLADELLSLDE